MRLEQLYYFVKTADMRALSAVSDELFISQQALSSSIKKLENEFNATLFTRTPKGMVLTKDGEYFYGIARQMLAQYEQLRFHFFYDQETSYEPLSIGINPKVKEAFMPKVISYFYKEYPNFDISYHSLQNNDMIPSMESGEINLGVLPVLEVNGNLWLDLPDGYTFEPFFTNSLALLTAPNSPFANFQTISMATIVKHPVVLESFTPKKTDMFYSLLQYFCKEPEVIWTDSFSLQMAMVRDGLGSAINLHSNLNNAHNLCRIPITNNIKIQVGFVLRENLEENELRDFYMMKTKGLLDEDFFVF